MDSYGEIKRKIRSMAAVKTLIYEGEVVSVSGDTCTVNVDNIELKVGSKNSTFMYDFLKIFG